MTTTELLCEELVRLNEEHEAEHDAMHCTSTQHGSALRTQLTVGARQVDEEDIQINGLRQNRDVMSNEALHDLPGHASASLQEGDDTMICEDTLA